MAEIPLKLRKSSIQPTNQSKGQINTLSLDIALAYIKKTVEFKAQLMYMESIFEILKSMTRL